MKEKHLFFGFIFFILVGNIMQSCNTQHSPDKIFHENEIDSLLNKAGKLINTDLLMARKLYKDAMRLETDSTQWYEILTQLALTYLYTAEFDSVKKITNRITTRYGKKDILSPRENYIMGRMYNMKAYYLTHTAHNDSVLFNLERSIQHLKKSDEKLRLPDMYINLADHHSRTGNYLEAISYYNEGLALADTVRLPADIRPVIHAGLGHVYSHLHNFERADYYYELAFNEMDSLILLGDVFFYYNSRGNSYYFRDQLEKAIPYFKEAFEVVKDNQEYQYQNGIIKGNLGEAFLLTNQLDSAQFYLDQAMAFFRKTDNISGTYHMETLQFELEIRRNNLAKAKKIMASFTPDDKIEPIYIRLRKRYLQHYYEAIRDYANAYKQLKENTALEDSISNTLIKMRAEETDMRYKHDAALLKQSHLIEHQQSEMKSLQLNRYIWILASALLLLIAVFIYLYMRRQRAYQAEKHRNRIVGLRMENIRNRVSPHFIFNILNHIISRYNREDKSYQELFNLIKLMRFNLTLTERLNISLEEELDFVETYALSRQQESGKEIQLKTEIDDQIDLSAIQVPSMAIQIPVENSIKHAFAERQENNFIKVFVRGGEKSVIIKIEDNGGGLYMRAENHGYQSTGTGLKVLTQTIQLLNTYNKEKIIFSIENRENKSGCVVTYVIPMDYNYELG